MCWCHHGKAGQSSCQWLQVHKLLIAVIKGRWWDPCSVLYLPHQVGKFLFSARELCRAMCSNGFTLVKKSLRRQKNTLAEIERQIQHTFRLLECVSTLFPMQEFSKVYEQGGNVLFLGAPGQAFERWQHEKQGCGSFPVGFAAGSLWILILQTVNNSFENLRCYQRSTSGLCILLYEIYTWMPFYLHASSKSA